MNKKRSPEFPQGFLVRQANRGILWTRSWPLSGFELLKHQKSGKPSMLNLWQRLLTWPSCKWLTTKSPYLTKMPSLWVLLFVVNQWLARWLSQLQGRYQGYQIGFSSESPPFSGKTFLASCFPSSTLDFPEFFRSSKWKHRECFWMLVPPRRVFCVLLRIRALKHKV